MTKPRGTGRVGVPSLHVKVQGYFLREVVQVRRGRGLSSLSSFIQISSLRVSEAKYFMHRPNGRGHERKNPTVSRSVFTMKIYDSEVDVLFTGASVPVTTCDIGPVFAQHGTTILARA